MQDRNRGYIGMYLSAFYFTLVLFTEYYVLYVYYFGHRWLADHAYALLLQSGLPTTGIESRWILCGMLFGGIMMYRPKKKKGLHKKRIVMGLMVSAALLLVPAWFPAKSPGWMLLSMAGYGLSYFGLMTYGMQLFALFNFSNPAEEDPFNEGNETFLQMEECLDTEYSANIPYTYFHKGKKRKGWLNFVNLFRALLVIGTPGSGKSFSVIEEIMGQFIFKKYAMVIYDFKFNALTKKAYGYLQEARSKLGKQRERKLPKMYFICFDDLQRTHRNNPIDPYGLVNQSDAIDTAATLMKNLNPEWIKKQDYFSRSAISFTSGCIWYLKKKAEETGLYICTPGHLALLTTVKIDVLMEIMMQDVEVRQILVPFRDALEKKAMDQLAGQTSTVQISLSSIATKEIFYVMSGNDFNLEVNDPQHPKIISLQNNPGRKEVYSAPLSLYMNTILKRINRPGRRHMALIIDELPTIFIMLLRTIIDTGRENKIATVLGIQSVGQLILDYGRELADVIYDNCANIICGAAKGETAKRLTELFGKIHQEKISTNTSSSDTSTNLSTQMMDLLPKSKIAAMSTGYFAGLTADTFEDTITEKKCYGLLQPDISAKKRASAHELPIVKDFRPKDFKDQQEEYMRLVDELDLLEGVIPLFQKEVGYLEFYGTVLDKVAKTRFQNGTQRKLFKDLVKRLKLFDYRQGFGKAMERENKKGALRRLYVEIIDEFLVHCEMDRIAQEVFDQILDEVDALVKMEYRAITGNELETAIFDEKKINGEIAKSMNRSKTEVSAFYDHWGKGLDNETAAMIDGLKDEFENENREGYCSFPVENMD
ncbi:type IV secretory system conjugative DNA transfer family protein [Flagellimonas meridianipacifica]|uniref:Type IV secretory system conjugative DNA transfer VirD4/TraG family protein n=1 Tax=Flagellimonas meridianipacifica TaxID=1080225 RepID=A0A2T0MF94_9FLAO|nr:type IV secretory system conjugative DNA transfer family protein [Allomuricauda pacifica]PRX56245.1 type IV secretory system conjugative DNA transfer VirD4/TraG family protein [Allomuricauda pacifica]